jgi:cytochrome b6-f complex iron-sulfur subunit
MSGTAHFHHLIFEVSDLDRSERFYGEGLGLQLLGRDLWPEDGPTATFQLPGGQLLVLVQVPEIDPDRQPAYTGFFFAPEDWDGLLERMDRLGGLTRHDKKAGLRAVGELKAQLRDPDGHVLEVTAHRPSVYEMPAADQGKIDAGRIEDFAIGSMTRFPEGKFFLLRTTEGFLALSEVCAHQQFTITYQPEHYRFYCPLHRYRYTRTGHVISRVAPLNVPPLHCYAIEYVDGRVIVDTDVSIPRSEEEVDEVVPVPNEALTPGA